MTTAGCIDSDQGAVQAGYSLMQALDMTTKEIKTILRGVWKGFT